MSATTEIVRWKDLEDAWFAVRDDRRWIWPTAKIGDVLQRRKHAAASGDKPLGKITFSGELIEGATEASRPFRAAPGQIVWSKIRLAQGSVALVPQGSSFAVSAEYPTYEVDVSRVLPAFVLLFLRSTPFRMSLNPTGNTSKARISPAIFERQEVPVPPLEVQQELVDAYGKTVKSSLDLRRAATERRREAWKDFEAAIGFVAKGEAPARSMVVIASVSQLERWDVDNFYRVAASSEDEGPAAFNWPVVPLQTAATVSGGITKGPSNRPGKNARPYLRVANVRKGYLDLEEIKTIEVLPNQMQKARLEVGDILFVEGNGSLEEVGRSALWGGEIPDCTHQNHLIRARFDHTLVHPRFALAWFNSGPGRAYFTQVSRTTSGLNNLNVSQIRQAPLLLPPLDVQLNLAEKIWTVMDAADAEEAASRSAYDRAEEEFELSLIGY